MKGIARRVAVIVAAAACTGILCALVASSAFASRWDGTVTDESGTPLSGITCRLAFADPGGFGDNWPSQTEVTDVTAADGRYSVELGVADPWDVACIPFLLSFTDPSGVFATRTEMVYDLDPWASGVFAYDVMLTVGVPGPDVTAPRTTTNLARWPFWSCRPVTVAFQATDEPGGSGVARTEYRVDGLAWVDGTEVTVLAPSDGSNDGLHVIEYLSVDKAGNAEPINRCEVGIDTAPPALSVTGAVRIEGGFGTIRLTASDDRSDYVSVVLSFRRAGGARGAVAEVVRDGVLTDGVERSVAFVVDLPQRHPRLSVTVVAIDLAGNPSATTEPVRVRVN